jgi:23S rRNA (adenine2503-C2)-methyltransferase
VDDGQPGSPGPPRPATRPDLLGLPLARLADELTGTIDRPFRARQVFDALHRRRAASFEAMTELPAPLRSALAERYSIAVPEIAERRDADDGTTKFLLRLADGASIEAVDIPERTRRTLCLSSQAGCGLACAFCVTGYWGAGRNLAAGEIVGQVRLLERVAALPESYNLVFMGMGEPLLNLDAVRAALEVLSTTLALRRVTVSTAGVVPGIDALAAWPERPNLAVSLHAPDDERRDRIMPINRSYPLAELVAALRRFPLEPRRRITIEYLLLDGFNDRPEDADALVRRLRGVPVKFNLIPLNPDPVLPEWMRRPEPARVESFRARLERLGARVTVRRQRGHDVAAACGQLRAFARPARGRAARRGASGAGAPGTGRL